MNTYRTDWRAAPVLGGLLLLLLASGYPSAVSLAVFLKGAFAISLLVFFIILLITVFSYVTTLGSTLTFVYLLLYRRTIDIHSITEVANKPTYIAARSQFRSLFILYKDKAGQEAHIELRITIFPEAELARLIRDLKRLNPNIHLDSYSARLATTASGH